MMPARSACRAGAGEQGPIPGHAAAHHPGAPGLLDRPQRPERATKCLKPGIGPKEVEADLDDIFGANPNGDPVPGETAADAPSGD